MSDRVLLVERDEAWRTRVAGFFEGSGMEVLQAATAAECLAVLDREPTDVVVLDLHRHEGLGPGLVDELRERGVAVLLLPEPRDAAAAVRAVRPGLLDGHLPGNVREMRNVLERAMIRGQGGTRLRGAYEATSLKEAERRLVAKSLRHHKGNRTRAARELGVSRVTLLKKIRDYGLQDEGSDGD